MKEMAAYSDKRHDEDSDEELSCKWVIGMENAKANLNVTMQINVGSEILPLTKRYRTDLLSQKLRRLSVRLYIENLYYDATSVRGNKFDQL